MFWDSVGVFWDVVLVLKFLKRIERDFYLFNGGLIVFDIGFCCFS